MAFKDIKGQERAVEFFRNAVNGDRFAHAYLFFGPENVGKTLSARTLAKFLNCQNPVREESLLIDCCDVCLSCRKINNLNHPDVHWVAAQGKSKKISIDEVRTVQKEIALKAYEGKFKVFIIQDAQEMTPEAANSLLKTLEEPPKSSLLILISNNTSNILPTIISRCQIIKFYPLGYESIKKVLCEDYRLKADNAHFLSILSEGRLGRALSLNSEDALNKKNRLIEQACRRTPAVSPYYIFNLKDKKELAVQMRYLLNWFRDIFIFKIGGSDADIINADRIEQLRSRTRLFNFDDLGQIIGSIDEAYRLIGQNVNPKIALEVMLRRLAKCKR